MQEKDRILELVKKGIISSGEAIELLEQLGRKKENNETVEVYKEEIPENTADYYEKVDKKRLNTILGNVSSAVSSITEITNPFDQRINNLEKTIAEKKERLTELETLASIDHLTLDDEMELQRITEILDSLMEQLESLEIEKQQAMEENIRKTKEELNRKYKKVKEKVHEANWEEKVDQSTGRINHVVGNLTNKVSKMVKDVVETAVDSVEWQEKTVNVPKIAVTEFEQTIQSEPTLATIIDIKVANGEIEVETWDEDYVKIDAKYKIYGVKATNDTPLDLLAERSTIEITDEKMVYHVPNKRISCDVMIYVPDVIYDYTKIQTLNANITLNELKGKDFYLKVQNGDVNLNDVSAIMMEMDMINGDCDILDGDYRDVFVKNINGDLRMDSEVISYVVTTVNGDINIVIDTNKLKTVKANTTNGDIIIDIDEDLSIEAIMKTSFGEIVYNKDSFETVLMKKEIVSEVVQIKKMMEALPINMTLATVAGDISINE